MRIGVNARTFPVPEPGGSVQTAMQLTSELIENTSHEVILFGDKSLSNSFEVPIQSRWANENQLWGILWERTILPRLVTQSNIDVLYCPNGNAPLRELDAPVIMCIHDVNAQKGMSAVQHQLYRRVTVPSASRVCDAIVTVSEFSKKEISEYLPVTESKISVIYNGVDEHYFSGNSKRIDLPERYCLFVGSLNPRKNIQGLVKGFQQAKSNRDIELVFVGPRNKDIFDDIDIPHSKEITYCGYLDIAEVKYAYENAEMLVYPSFYEGFGLPPLESLACGTPVVASDRGALTEVLGGAARYVNPDSPTSIAEGIEATLTQETVDESQLKSQARNFTWEKVATRLVQVLESTN